MIDQMNYKFDANGLKTMKKYIELRTAQPNFANGRSIRNALDRMRLRQANRLFKLKDSISKEDLSTIKAEDIEASRVFKNNSARK